MASHHTLGERLSLYRKGWQRGAGSRVVSEELKDDSDFQNGYQEGRIAFGAAMEVAREKLDAPPPSILRTQGASVQFEISVDYDGHPDNGGMQQVWDADRKRKYAPWTDLVGAKILRVYRDDSDAIVFELVAAR